MSTKDKNTAEELFEYKKFLEEAKARTMRGVLKDNWFSSQLMYFEKFDLLNEIDNIGRARVVPLLDKELEKTNILLNS